MLKRPRSVFAWRRRKRVFGFGVRAGRFGVCLVVVVPSPLAVLMGARCRWDRTGAFWEVVQLSSRTVHVIQSVTHVVEQRDQLRRPNRQQH